MNKWLVAETVNGNQLVYYDGQICMCVINIPLNIGAAKILADNLNNCNAKPEAIE